MKQLLIVFCASVLLLQEGFSVDEDVSVKNNEVPAESAEDEFMPLTDNIKREVSGAFFGLGLTYSKIKNKVALKNISSGTTYNLKENNTQPSLSLIVGGGGSFYKRWYAGIDLELVRRFSNKEKGKWNLGDNGLTDIDRDGVHIQRRHNCDAAVIFDAYTGLNADVRFGYQLQNGVLPYLTFGFSKENGKVVLYDHGSGQFLTKQSYGSFHPTLGVGIEHRWNHKWGVRLDLRMSIPSTDTGKRFCGYSQRAKTSKFSARIAIIRNI